VSDPDHVENGRKAAIDAAEAHARGVDCGLPGLREHFGEAEATRIAKLLEYREPAPHRGPSPAGTILVNPGELPRVVDEAEAALLKANCGIYQRGTSLVRPVWSKLKAADNKDTFAHLLVPVDEKHLVETYLTFRHQSGAFIRRPLAPTKRNRCAH
jgi:hypothetical protein